MRIVKFHSLLNAVELVGIKKAEPFLTLPEIMV
jgi:hypothetical protein